MVVADFGAKERAVCLAVFLMASLDFPFFAATARRERGIHAAVNDCNVN